MVPVIHDPRAIVILTNFLSLSRKLLVFAGVGVIESEREQTG